jgi:hypothetical protein
MAAISKNIVSRKMRYLNRYLIFFLEHTVAISFFSNSYKCVILGISENF